MTKAPERIWAKYSDQYANGIRGLFIATEPEDGFKAFIPEDLSDALIAAAYEAAAEACANETWRHIGDDAYSVGLDRGAREQASACAAAILALIPADARAALERVAQPRWYRMDDPENPPPEYRHIRGLWIVSAQTKERLYFQADLGHIHDETGEFVDQYNEDFGFAAEDYTHWTPLLAPPEDEG